MLASRAGRVISAAVAVVALVTGWLMTGPMIARQIAQTMERRARRAEATSVAVQAVRAVFAGPRRDLEVQAMPVPDYARDIGTPHPIHVRLAAANGRWVIACQARVETDGKPGISVWSETDSLGGDQMTPYLIRGGGAGEAIEGLVAHSRDDRWIVVLQAGQLVLIDDVQGTRSILANAELRSEDDLIEDLAVFSDDSQRLIYLRDGHDGRVIVVRQLALQRERELVAPARVMRVVPEPGSPWARVRFAYDDGSPFSERGPLESRLQTCDAWGLRGDTPHWERWLQLETGALVDRPDVLAHVEGLEVRKHADGSIAIGVVPIVPASCDGVLEAATVHPLRVIAACRGAAPLEMFGPGMHAVLPRTKLLGWHEAMGDALAFCPALGCFALADGHRIALRGYPHLIVGSHILSHERTRFFVTDVATEQATPVATGDARGGGPFVAIDRVIVDLAHGRVLGEVERKPIVVDLRGRALIHTGAPDVRSDTIAPGPLRWAVPRVATAQVDAPIQRAAR